MQPEEARTPKSDPPAINYEAEVPTACRVVRVPRSIYRVHRFVSDAVDVVGLVYGIVLRSLGWVFKQVGIVFLPPSDHRREPPPAA
jgi:hypothetical protein